ncbi:NAD(P)H-dependent FMN reductase [Diaminobutyricimonas aerilata]|uniref:NAD(P)H-dependent FMN reductase n=1 Tax=Diaminobutyricimonas aerilata TaxID=1162967 RepID=A0A2M9CEY3_9MICO|nr:NAD(P)H-dependent oxidoreductase [Diaminobutyricimonas aerilata]PJJ70484.1 NAD(P)H-dependent FMN reductase [Diaminobutyricimonas aerilata]
MSDLRIGVIVGSTRPGRVGKQVADWVLDRASARGDARYELIDLADFTLPHLDEANSPILGLYEKEHTKKWAATIARYDGYVFVTPEYNRSIPGTLKNAIDFLYAEWNDKAAGIVSYGGAVSGARAAEHLRLILAELQVADVRQPVLFSTITDFEDYTVFKEPAAYHVAALEVQLDQLVAWATALRSVRAGAASAA